MVAARTTTTTTSTRGRRPHKARTFLTYSVPGGASRAAESISLRALRVATPRTVTAPAVDAVAHTPELVAQVFAVLRHDEVQQAKRATRCWFEVSRTTQTAARLGPVGPRPRLVWGRLGGLPRLHGPALPRGHAAGSRQPLDARVRARRRFFVCCDGSQPPHGAPLRRRGQVGPGGALRRRGAELPAVRLDLLC